MELVSCEHPKRVHNPYTDEYMYVPCGTCNTCKNRKTSIWISRLESERSKSAYTFFVTLTYSDINLPFYHFEDGFNGNYKDEYIKSAKYMSNRDHDIDSVAFNEFDVLDGPDYDLFKGFLMHQGIPYCSKSDIILFHKRLNKYFHDKVTHKYKNFRYFVCSEYGSTTLRPHFHAIYFVNDSEIARCMREGILECWKFGIIDCQYVEKSACSYVAEYVNKSADLPSFYKTGALRPFFLYSRSPFIGNGVECIEVDKEAFDQCSVTRCVPSKKDSTSLAVVTHDKAYENRLYPKCVLFKQVSHSIRVELYSITRRFCGQVKKFSQFIRLVRAYMYQTYEHDFRIFHFESDFARILYEHFWLPYKSGIVDDFHKAVNWLRRLYYLSKKVCKRAYIFRISVDAYVRKIEEYYNNKELYLLSQFYQFQEDYSEKHDCVDLAMMYPAFLYDNGYTYAEYAKEFDVSSYDNIVADSSKKSFDRKRTHFKNAYLQSLKDKIDYQYLFNLLICFYHAKKCNETLEAIAP